MIKNRCKEPNCIQHPVKGEWCVRHYAQYKEDHKKVKRQKFSYHKLYYTNTWKALRLKKLAESPLCVQCGASAEEVDHIIDHKGNIDLFYTLSNLQSLCKSCHSRKTAQTINMKAYKEVDEIITFVITNNSIIEEMSKSLNLPEESEYLLQLIVKGSSNLIFNVKSTLEAQKLEHAFVLNKRVRPKFKTIQGD